MPSLAVKVYRDNEIRRCRLEIGEDEGRFGYQRLVAKIRQLFPDLETKNVRVMWKDNDGEFVVIGSISDFKEAVANLPEDQVLRVYVSENEKSEPKSARPVVDDEQNDQSMEQDQQQSERQPRADANPIPAAPEPEADPSLHRHVVCDGCNGQIRGIRYKCLTCPDFDLCSTCMSGIGHDEHPTLRIVSPTDATWKEAFLASQAFEFIPKNFCHGHRRRCNRDGEEGCTRGQQRGCQQRGCQRAEADRENTTEEAPKQQSDAAPILDEEIMRNVTSAIETVMNIFGVPVATSGCPKQQEPANKDGQQTSGESKVNEEKVEAALNYMLAMGYRNDCGHLKALLEKHRGDVSAVMDHLNQM